MEEEKGHEEETWKKKRDMREVVKRGRNQGKKRKNKRREEKSREEKRRKERGKKGEKK